MTLENKKLIIFDLDGTLVDSAPDLALALNQMLNTLGREPFSQETIRSWVGNGAQTLVKRGLSGTSTIDDSIDEALFEKALTVFLQAYSQNLCKATLTYPNVRTTLQSLQEYGYQLALVTNKPFAFVPPLLKGLQLEGFFELILGGDSLEKKKPDPLPLQHVCDTLGISIKDAVMVGDSKNDIYAANAAQMDSIGVSYGYNYNQPIANFKPTVVIDDIAHILQLVNRAH